MATDLGSDPASEADVLPEDWDGPSPPEACEDNKDETNEGDTVGDVLMAATTPTAGVPVSAGRDANDTQDRKI